jgi:hypothetical protein
MEPAAGEIAAHIVENRGDLMDETVGRPPQHLVE